MGNIHSVPKHNLYIIKVSNKDLPLIPFIHTIVGYNNIPIKDTDPLILSNILRSQDLVLDVFDILQNKKFKITVPKFTDPETGKLGINVTKLVSIPTLLNIRVTAVSESSNTELRIGDNILGIEGSYLEKEDELIYEIRNNINCRLIVIREDRIMPIEISGNKLGCEIGTGLIHKPISKEYILDGYTGKVQKMNEEGEVTDNQIPLKNNSSLNNGNISENNSSLNNGNIPENNKDSSNVNTSENNKDLSNPNNSNNIYSTENNNDSNNIETMNENPNLGEVVASDDNLQHFDISNNQQGDSNMSLDTIRNQIEQVPSTTENENLLPKIPNKTGMVVNKDRTESYVYKSPKKHDNIPLAITSQTDKETFNERNQRIIYEEANLPTEKEFFQGQVHSKTETANVLNTDIVCKDDFLINEGNRLMKSEVFEERKKDNQKMIDIFEDDDDALPFETKKDTNSQSI